MLKEVEEELRAASQHLVLAQMLLHNRRTSIIEGNPEAINSPHVLTISECHGQVVKATNSVDVAMEIVVAAQRRGET